MGPSVPPGAAPAAGLVSPRRQAHLVGGLGLAAVAAAHGERSPGSGTGPPRGHVIAESPFTPHSGHVSGGETHTRTHTRTRTHTAAPAAGGAHGGVTWDGTVLVTRPCACGHVSVSSAPPTPLGVH